MSTAVLATVAAGRAASANTPGYFNGSDSSNRFALDDPANWTLGAVPTASNDAVVDNSVTNLSAGATLTFNSSTPTFGSLDVNTASGITIYNQVASTTVTLTLGGSTGNAYAPNAADLLYVGTGSTLTVDSSSTSTAYGSLPITLAQSGNFDVVGSASIASAVSLGANTLTKIGAGTLTASGVISGTGAVVVGGGTILASGTNTFSGGLSINAGGTYVFSVGAALPNGTTATPTTLNGGLLEYSNTTNGNVTTTTNVKVLNTGAAAGVVSTLDAFYSSTVFNARLVAEFGNATNPITGSGGLNVSGGTAANADAIEFGGPNTYSGPTVVGPQQSLIMDLAGSSANSALTLGGTLGFTTTSAGTTTARTATTSFSSIAFGIGGSNVDAIFNASNLAVGTLTTNQSLGALSTRATGGTVDFNYAAGGGVFTTTTSVGGTGAIGGYATFGGGASFAVVNASGGITGLSTFGTSYAAATATTDFDVNGANGSFASPTINSLRFSTAQTVTINGSLTVASGGILVTPTAGGSASTITGGTLTTGNGTDLIVQQFNNASGGTMVISSTIVDGTAGATALTKAGPGTLILTASNTYTGTTYIGGGTLQVGNGGTAGTLGANAVVDNAALAFNQSGTVALTNTVTGGGTIVQAGTGVLDLSGNTNGESGGVVISSTGTVLIANGGSLGIAPAAATTDLLFTGNGTLRFNGSSTAGLGTTRTVYIGTGVNATVDTNGTNQTISGQIYGVTSDSGTLTKVGAGLLNLTALNDTFGGVILDAGTLEVIAGSSFGASPAGLTFAGNSTLLAGSQFASTGVGAARTFTFNTGVTGTIDTNGLSPTLGNVFTGGGSFVKSDTGTLTLTAAETYTGNTSVTGGTLALSNSSSSNIIPSSPKIYVGPGTTLSVGGLSGGGLALASGQTLAGSGTVTGAVTVGAGSTITAGSGPTTADTIGTLTTGAETLTGASYLLKLNGASLAPATAKSGASGTPGVGSDLLVMSGVTLTSPASVAPLSVGGSYTAGANYSVVIAQIPAADFTPGSDPFASVLSNLSLNTSGGSPYIVAGSASFSDKTDAGGDDELVLDFTAAAPEPTSLFLAALAAAPLALGRRTRRATAAAAGPTA